VQPICACSLSRGFVTLHITLHVTLHVTLQVTQPAAVPGWVRGLGSWQRGRLRGQLPISAPNDGHLGLGVLSRTYIYLQ